MNLSANRPTTIASTHFRPWRAAFLVLMIGITITAARPVPAQDSFGPMSFFPPAATSTPAEPPPLLAPPQNPVPLAAPAAEAPPGNLADSLEERMNGGVALALERVWAVCNFPLTIVDGRPITPGSIVSSFILLYIGYVAARVLSWWIGRRLLPRLRMPQAAIAPLQTISHYVLVGSFTMLALHLSNVPLTAFTFLGGAIAIGVGFGSQTVMNNFISGLILLAERPVRVGDLIEVEGHTGRITQIGPRSTHMLTATNLVIVLPNSKLLEGTLVNWTLTDDSIRTKITCGVAYGSRTRDVERWLMEAARHSSDVLTEPAPFVNFAEFGDNALIFELHFWMSLREGPNRMEVESELRFEIDDLFRAAGIVMAYPQRDIHLNVMRPVEVRMLSEQGSRPNSRAAA